MSKMRQNGGLIGYPSRIFILASCFTRVIYSHEHHDDQLPPGQGISFEPVDSILWTHIVFMTIAFGVLFPIGMVNRLRKLCYSRL